MSRFLLCTDMDRTLIPNGEQPESPAARTKFKRLVMREEITLAYVTGRHRALIEKAIADYDLPFPDFAIADVGTTIFQVDKSEWKLSEEWDETIAADWHGLTHDSLYALLSVFPALRLQEKEKQGRHKLSFYVPIDTDHKRLLNEMHARLDNSDIKANLIWSIDEKEKRGLLDILPVSANKLHAIRFLMQKTGFSQDNALFAGDSGNDMDVLLSGIPSVLVGNAGAEVQSAAKSASQGSLYVAKGNYLGMNGNYSAGILEGAAHYWPEADTWLKEMN